MYVEESVYLFYVNIIFVIDQELEDLITEIVTASNRGVSAIRNATGEPNWSFGQSLFFSSTIVTTIGIFTIRFSHSSKF